VGEKGANGSVDDVGKKRSENRKGKKKGEENGRTEVEGKNSWKKKGW